MKKELIIIKDESEYNDIQVCYNDECNKILIFLYLDNETELNDILNNTKLGTLLEKEKYNQMNNKTEFSDEGALIETLLFKDRLIENIERISYEDSDEEICLKKIKK